MHRGLASWASEAGITARSRVARQMFILRSAFWLTLAFIVMGPKSVDLGAAASDFSSQAMAAGQQLIVSQIIAGDCTSVQCFGGKALAAVALGSSPSVGATMQDSPIGPAPVPRPRPDWMG
jgi:hypothetical protein